jgi:hypothetical protein
MAAPKGFDIPASVRGTWAQSMTDMYHDPNLVLLLSEYVEDSWAHGAKHVELTLVQSEHGGYFHATYLDDGDGLADASRIQNPSSDAGTGTSVYGQGHRMARIRADNDRSGFKFLIAFKPAGKLTAKGFKGPWTKDGLAPWDCGINEEECPWDSVNDHGYYEEFRMASDSFPKACADPAKACDAFRSHIKEIMCVRFPQRMFDRMSFKVRTCDSSNITMMCESTPDAPWKTLVSVLESSPQVNRYNPIQTVKDECEIKLRFFEMCMNNTDEDLASFTNYGSATKLNASAGILIQCLGDRPIRIMPLNAVYGAGKHGAHQRRIVVAEMTPVGGSLETWDLTKTPVPTTIKTDFVPSKLLSSIHEFIKTNKPVGFLAGAKKPLPVAPPVLPAPAAAPAPPEPVDPAVAVRIKDEDIPVIFNKVIGSGTLSTCTKDGINTLVFEKDRLAANSEFSVVSCIASTALKLCKDRGWNSYRVNIEMKVAAGRAENVNNAIALLRDSGMRIASNISVV